MPRGSNALRVAAEFLLIVVGVLTALAAESWVDRQRERDSGAAYLSQLRIDAETNQALLAAAIEQQDESQRSVEAVRSARRDGVTIPADSMAVLIGRQHLLQPARVQLVMGTVSALVSTSELNLIQDPEVRLALLRYASRMDQLRDGLTLLEQPLKDYGSDIVAAWQVDTNFEELDPRLLGEWITDRHDPRVLEALAHIWLDGANTLVVLRSMSAATDSLIAVLE